MKEKFSNLITPGVKHMLLATFWFALMNVMVKNLAHLPTSELVFFRCGVATCIGFIALHRAKVDWLGSNRTLLLLRGLFGTIALYAFFYTVQHMPLGTAVTLQYLSPIFTTIFAIFLLNEHVRPIQWLWFAISFCGILVIKGVDTGISWELLGVGIFSAIFSALAYNMVRSMREKEHPLVVVLHFQLLGAIVGGIVSVFNWKQPVGLDWIWILLLGILTQLGQENLTRSLQLENMAKVTILNYLGVGYAILFGWMFFHETHVFMEFIGMLLVVAGIVLNLITTPKVIKNLK
ncbi:MAG: DMT family transporter [Bacteroidia bacterium]|nr:DMT family transporter [Bacteroidia bacterium]